MPPRRKGYSSLDELYLERDAVAWYWRVAALAASWLLLGGYLILPTTFESDPDLRFSRVALATIIVLLLAGGYALTGLLYFFVPSWLYRSESLIYPALCSSAFGLIGTLYPLASSHRYRFDNAAGVGVALSSSSTAIYAILLVWVQRKIARVRLGGTTYQAGHAITITGGVRPDGRESEASSAGLYQEPNYYRNYIANMHPTAMRAPSPHTGRTSTNSLHEQASYQHLRDPTPSPPYGNTTYYDPPRNHSTPDIAPPSPFQPPQIGEDEQVSQHLARLLLNTRDGEQGPDASQATFRIDWRTVDDDDDADSPRGIQMRTRTGSGSRLVPPGKLAQAAAHAGPPLARLAAPRAGSDVGRGRAAAPRDGHRRGKSRDDRRREIELGFVAAPAAGRSNGDGATRQR